MHYVLSDKNKKHSILFKRQVWNIRKDFRGTYPYQTTWRFFLDQGKDRRGRQGIAGRGLARAGEPRQGRQGEDYHGAARCDPARWGKAGMAWCGKKGQGME